MINCLKLYAVVLYSVNTFTNKEWGSGRESSVGYGTDAYNGFFTEQFTDRE